MCWKLCLMPRIEKIEMTWIQLSRSSQKNGGKSTKERITIYLRDGLYISFFGNLRRWSKSLNAQHMAMTLLTLKFSEKYIKYHIDAMPVTYTVIQCSIFWITAWNVFFPQELLARDHLPVPIRFELKHQSWHVFSQHSLSLSLLHVDDKRFYC